MNADVLDALFQRFDSLTILVIGDVMADAYIRGKVDRISPEAPVPILRANPREIRLGGAANVALNLRSLGANVKLCALIGDDPNGNDLLSLATREGIDTSGIVVSPSRPTTVKTRIMAASQHLLRLDEEDDQPTLTSEKSLILESALQGMENADAIVFEDYDKGLIFPELIEKVVQKAKSLQIPVTVDPKKRNFLDYKSVTLFKPNLKELKEGLKIDVDARSLPQVQTAGKQLQNALNADAVLLTLSEYGMAINQGEAFHHVQAMQRDISDVSGAGDTVISVATLCLAAGCDLQTTLILSNMAGGLVCEFSGVVPIPKALLLKEAKAYTASTQA